MNARRVLNTGRIAVIASLVLASALMASRTRAGDWDQSIKVNFSGPVQVPGHVLPAGTYWFELANTNDREVVRILNKDQSRTYAIVQTINRDRPLTQGGTEVTIAEGRGGGPAAVLAWFYPGDSTGHEFVYPKQIEKELATAKRDTQVYGD